jgi:hypothetical protein
MTKFRHVCECLHTISQCGMTRTRHVEIPTVGERLPTLWWCREFAMLVCAYLLLQPCNMWYYHVCRHLPTYSIMWEGIPACAMHHPGTIRTIGNKDNNGNSKIDDYDNSNTNDTDSRSALARDDHVSTIHVIPRAGLAWFMPNSATCAMTGGEAKLNTRAEPLVHSPNFSLNFSK